MLRPGLLGRWFVGARWKLAFGAQHFNYGKQSLAYTKVKDVHLSAGWFWETVTFSHGQSQVELKGLRKGSGAGLAAVLRRWPAILRALETVKPLFAMDHYVPNRSVRQAVALLKVFAIDPRLVHDVHAWLQPHLSEREWAKLTPNVRRLRMLLAGDLSEVANCNEQFVKAELVREQGFFATVESSPLSEEQARAAVVFEDRNLLIASAGSGKSSTVVAKIGYALRKKLAEPEQILALAFGADAREELKTRCQEKLAEYVPNGMAIHASTFHALGMRILSEAGGAKVTLAPWVGNEAPEAGVIADVVKSLMANAEFRISLLNFLALWSCGFEEELNWLWKTPAPGAPSKLDVYNAKLRLAREADEGPRRLPTMQGELVRSEQELSIANWLFIHDIKYEYEKAFTENTATSDKRQYFPDFYYPEIDCWHEHYALNKQGEAPAHFSPGYLDSVVWKRNLHSDLGSNYFETTSAQFQDEAVVFATLETELVARGLQPRLLPWDEVERKLPGELRNHYALLKTAIKHLKSSVQSFEQLRQRARLQVMPARGLAFLKVFEPVFDEYEALLRRQGVIDFEDMICKSAEAVRKGQYKSPYRLIFVDEFQDISPGRADLVRALLEQDADAKLFAVGDDWQSIYRFTGADISVMTKFASNFGVTATNYLTKTFRSNQGIATLASDFIQKNPAQLRKTVTSVDSSHVGTFEVVPFLSDDDLASRVEKLLEQLQATAKEKGVRSSVFFLGRYHRVKPQKWEVWQSQHRDGLQLTFHSVHGSKGLQADYVFILGLTGQEKYGFPAKRTDDPLLQLVMPQAESYIYAEERRLMYVALTRAKHKVFLCAPADSPSSFVKALLDIAKPGTIQNAEDLDAAAALVCPACTKGRLVARTSRYGQFTSCNQFPDCDYKPPKAKAMKDRAGQARNTSETTAPR